MTFVESLLTWLVAASVRGSILVVVVLMLQWALRSWMPARWRLWMWLPAIVVFALPLLPQSRWSLHGTVIEKVAGSAWCCPTGTSGCEPGNGISVDSLGSYQSQWGWRIMGGCWLLGTAWFLGVVVWSHRCSMRRLRESSEPPGPALLESLQRAADDLGLRRLPAVLVCPGLSGPAVAGLWRPVLMVPAFFPGDLDEEEARLVLQHELLHLRRHDLWTNGLLCLLQAVHWFNPVAWLAACRIRFDCEQACDEAVLSRNGAECRVPYGHALIKIACGLTAPASNLAVLHMASSVTGLQTRIRAITGRRSRHPAWSLLWLGLIVGVTVVGATRSPYGIPEGIAVFGGRPSAAVAQARHLILSRVEMRDVPLTEALALLQHSSQEADASGAGLRFWLTPEAAETTSERRISVSLRDVSAWDALAVIAAQAGIGVDGNGEVICLKKRPATSVLRLVLPVPAAPLSDVSPRP